ncbi:MAG TPA: hypothetical protein VEL28_04415 [Candidatus Binatia bacterium]|nr:hypothetical protein [Candidatus Binatia bacterium]
MLSTQLPTIRPLPFPSATICCAVTLAPAMPAVQPLAVPFLTVIGLVTELASTP